MTFFKPGDADWAYTWADNLVTGPVYNHVIKMLIVLLASFVICWLPLQIVILYAEYRSQENTQLNYGEWYKDFQYFAYFLAYTNSALNPMIYAGFNENFRSGMLSLLWCRKKDKRSAVSLHHEEQSTTVTRMSRHWVLSDKQTEQDEDQQ